MRARPLAEEERGNPLAAELRAVRDENASLRGELAKAQDALAHLRVRYRQLVEELYLLKRRLHVAKAERLDDVSDAQLSFALLLGEAGVDDKAVPAPTSEEQPAPPPPADKPSTRRKTKPKGRRDLSKCNLPEVRVEIPDPELEEKADRIGVEV